MKTFDRPTASLADLSREIREGKIQLPDFQCGWLWDDQHVLDLVLGIASRSFPLGAWMLAAGGQVRT